MPHLYRMMVFTISVFTICPAAASCGLGKRCSATLLLCEVCLVDTYNDDIGNTSTCIGCVNNYGTLGKASATSANECLPCRTNYKYDGLYKNFVCCHACKEHTRAHKGLVDVGFVKVDLVAGYVCGNMHNVQGKACAGGLYVDHLVYCCVVQVGSQCDQVCSLALSCLTTVTAHRCARAQSYLERCLCILRSLCVCTSSCHTIQEE